MRGAGTAGSGGGERAQEGCPRVQLGAGLGAGFACGSAHTLRQRQQPGPARQACRRSRQLLRRAPLTGGRAGVPHRPLPLIPAQVLRWAGEVAAVRGVQAAGGWRLDHLPGLRHTRARVGMCGRVRQQAWVRRPAREARQKLEHLPWLLRWSGQSTRLPGRGTWKRRCPGRPEGREAQRGVCAEAQQHTG